MTIGIVVVAIIAAWVAGVPKVAITSTGSRTSSLAAMASRSGSPPAVRYSSATVRPSTRPWSRNPCRKLSHSGALSMMPMRGIFPAACCACTASGHMPGDIATAAPSSVMTSRRRIGFPLIR
jgi:hypothetical protein